MASTSDPVPRPGEADPYGDDVYFMAVALLFAKRSPDPDTKVGACVVNQDGNIVGVGYNKMPKGCEGQFPWDRDIEKKLENKYVYVCHAGLNAITNKTSVDVKGCTMYTTLFPCNECSKLIIQSGIRSLVYLSDKYEDSDETKASRRMLDTAGITLRQFESMQEVLDLMSIDPFIE